MPRVVRFNECGGPDVLRFDEIMIAAPGPDEVRIKVGAIGLNRAEAVFRSGGFGIPPLPSTLGFEAAGIVEAIGKAVTNSAIGDRVAVLPGLSMAEYGTYGESILYPAEMVAKIPGNVSLEAAAATWMQFLTAYALISVANIQPRDAVVITAASSSVGLAAIQITNAVNAIPIAVTRGQGKKAALLRHGAKHVIATDTQDMTGEIVRITEGQGASAILDAVAGPTLPHLVTAIATNGIIVIIGSLGGHLPALPVHEGMEKEVTIRCFSMRDIISNARRKSDAIAFIEKGLESGALYPVIDRVFEFDSIVDAHRYMETGEQFGKIIVKVN